MLHYIPSRTLKSLPADRSSPAQNGFQAAYTLYRVAQKSKQLSRIIMKAN